MKTGTDIVYIPRMEKIFNNERTFKKIFTDTEIARFKSIKNTLESMAGTFATKEALIKALQLGIDQVNLLDIEVIHDEKGVPSIVLHNELINTLKDSKITFSISHDKDYAIANVIIYF